MDANADYLRLLLLKNDSFELECFKNCTNHIREQQVEKNVIQHDIIPVVNSYINNIKGKRLVGLIVLRRILPQCPSDIFSDHALSWMQQCCKWDGETTNEELKILRLLIINSSFYPDVKKQVISFFLPRYASQLSIYRNVEYSKTVRLKLKCLRSIIENFSSPCGPYRNEFRKFLIFSIKKFPEQKKVIREASLCFVSLCQCSSKGQQGISQKELWTNQFNEFINTCHTLLDSIYSCVDIVGIQPPLTVQTLNHDLLEIFKGEPDDPVARFHRWKVTVAILSELLQYMFLCKYPVHKSFKPNDIFSLICRLLAVNGSTLKNCSQTNDIHCLNAILPDIHGSTFDILRTLIRTLKRNLIPYGSLICKLCLQSLKWTEPENCKFGTVRPFENFRCKVFTVLSNWLSVAGSSSSIELFADEIIPFTISNIEFLKPEIHLTSTSESSKGKRKKPEQNSSKNVNPSLIVDRTANKNTCVAAHKMVQSLIRNAHSLLKWEHHKTLQYTVISLLLQIVGSNTTACYPLPYSNVKCRLELFATLYTLTKWPHYKWKALLSLSNRIFNVGRNDHSEIASFCTLALTELEGLAHPRGPSLENSFFNEERDQNLAQKSALTFASVSSLKSLVGLSTNSTYSVGGINYAEQLVVGNEIVCENFHNNSQKINIVSANEPVVTQVEVSTSTDAMDSSHLSDVSETAVIVPSEPVDSNFSNASVPVVTVLDEKECQRPNIVEEDSISCKKLNIDNTDSVDSHLKDMSESAVGLCPEPVECSFPNASIPVVAVSNENEPQRRNIVEEDSTPHKKIKIDNSVTKKTENDPRVASMLSDFVDTLE